MIVVDNEIDRRHRAQVIDEAQALFAVPLRHLTETSPGKSRAIAAALDVATGDVLAFTDDDVDVDPTWMDTIRCVMSTPGISARRRASDAAMGNVAAAVAARGG